MKIIGAREAYDRTMDAIDGIRTIGIDVKITSDDFDAIQEGDPRPKGRVLIIRCSPKSTADIVIVSDAADECGWNVIGFNLNHGYDLKGRPLPMVYSAGFIYIGEWGRFTE